MSRSLLTTIDNPFNPSTQFKEWYAFDESKGYHTCSLLATFTDSSDELSDADREIANENAISEILELNPFGVHKRIKISD